MHSGLRGGNLLFHLQRLIDSGMIVRARHERGDYLLTEKGYAVLKGVVGIMMTLNEMKGNDGSAVTMTKNKEAIPGELKITPSSV